MTERLFVYGSLQPGGRNAHVLAEAAGEWERARVRGRLVDGAWGSALGYPALIPDPAAPPVPGWLLASDALAAHWARLDAFEGEAYRRVRVRAVPAGGGGVDAWVYALRESV